MQNTKTPFPYNLNKVRIHGEQVSAGDEIMQQFYAHSGPPILLAQFQQGKTGTCLHVIDRMRRSWEDQGKIYEIIYLIATADNDLKNQTHRRLHEAGLDSTVVKLLHHANLKSFQPNFDAECRLIIIDECHVALGSERPLDCFLKQFGIDYGRPIAEWSNPNNCVLSVSATPFETIIQHHLDAKCFTKVSLDMNENYYSIQDIQNNGRFAQAERVIKKKEVTPWYVARFDDFITRCQRYGNGFQVVRVTGNDNIARLKKHLQSQCGHAVNVIEFSNAMKNIKELDVTLSNPPAKPTVVIIRGSMRMGKTLSDTQYIRQWIEVPESDPAAIGQVVGRSCGYRSQESGHSKFDDTYMIYCDLDAVDEICRFYNNNELVPKGIRHNGTVDGTKTHDMCWGDFEEVPEHLKTNRKKGSKVSENSSQDIAKAILNEASRSGVDKRFYFVDGPNPDHRESWQRLESERPELVGKCVWFTPLPEPTYTVSFDGKYKPNSMFYDRTHNPGVEPV
jgi:hypothetical protein